VKRVVKRPGSRGGHVYLNKHGEYVYGTPPVGEAARATADPVARPPAPVVPPDKAAIPHYGEFGEWSPDAAKLYVRQTLAYAPALHRCAARYRAALGQGLKEGLAARYAFRGLRPNEIEDGVAALKRLGRLRAWDDYTRRHDEANPGRSLIPGDPPLQATPFMAAALRAGVPSAVAGRWELLSRIGDSPIEQVNDADDATLAERLLGIPSPEEPVRKGGLFLAKAVMRPGSRGGHVYWANGKLHYGTPPLTHIHARRIGTANLNPSWQAVGRLARRIIERGHRILFRAADGVKHWGQIISASGEVLSVLPDDAAVYDLLHTVCVPVERVLRVIPDKQIAKSEDEDGRPLRKSFGSPAVPDRPADQPAPDFALWAEAEA
jgi:hypothetical protein